jgi:hypothetical protein
VKSDNDRLESTLDRYMGRAGEPPAGQVASSVEAVWERLRPEAECSAPPARERAARRSHFAFAAAVVLVTVGIGLYAAQRTGLWQAMLPVQQQSSAVTVDPVRDRVASGEVAKSKESTESEKPVITSKPPAGAREEETVYTLVVAKNGSKLQDAEDRRRDAISWGGTYYNPTGPGQVTFSEKTTLRSWTNLLEGVLGVPVLDETGLKGTYTFSLEFTDPRDSRPRQADSPPDLFTAVREQLGLELRATKRRSKSS